MHSLKSRFRSDELIYDIEIGEFIQDAVALEAELSRKKAAAAPPDFAWYPHDSIGTLSLLDKLLTGRERYLRTLVGQGPMVDLGCGDGALSFAFESLGVEVHAIDHPPTNFNGMRGVKALKKALRSSVRIQSADLDSQFVLPVERCGLALFFGTLYHLKNPFGALETLAARARYCLLSTAITRFAPDQKTDLKDLPLAYLAGREGLKEDETNFWIFTETGLRVLVDRAGWDVVDWITLQDSSATLWGTQHDERVICLLRSRAFEPARRSQLLQGWHALENDAWRWTERRFSIAAEAPGIATLQCIVPELLELPITLRCGSEAVEFTTRGGHDARFLVASGVVEFEVDRWIKPDSTDARERGLIVRSVMVG